MSLQDGRSAAISGRGIKGLVRGGWDGLTKKGASGIKVVGQDGKESE